MTPEQKKIYDQNVYDSLRQILDDQSKEISAKFIHCLVLMIRYRTRVIVHDPLLDSCESVVYGGPFAGMKIPEALWQRDSLNAWQSNILPPAILFGAYEHELYPVVGEIFHRAYPTIINVGCGIGYYATGFARLLPDSRIIAYDIDPYCQYHTREMATLNGVIDRIQILDRCHHHDFQNFLGQHRSLVWCDIEGGEIDLLDPEKAPVLRSFDFVVETHPSMVSAQAIQTWLAKFEETHNIQTIDHKEYDRSKLDMIPLWLKNYFNALGPLDQLLALFDARHSATPWVFMTTKKS